MLSTSEAMIELPKSETVTMASGNEYPDLGWKDAKQMNASRTGTMASLRNEWPDLGWKDAMCMNATPPEAEGEAALSESDNLPDASQSISEDSVGPAGQHLRHCLLFQLEICSCTACKSTSANYCNCEKIKFYPGYAILLDTDPEIEKGPADLGNPILLHTGPGTSDESGKGPVCILNGLCSRFQSGVAMNCIDLMKSKEAIEAEVILLNTIAILERKRSAEKIKQTLRASKSESSTGPRNSKDGHGS